MTPPRFGLRAVLRRPSEGAGGGGLWTLRAYSETDNVPGRAVVQAELPPGDDDAAVLLADLEVAPVVYVQVFNASHSVQVGKGFSEVTEVRVGVASVDVVHLRGLGAGRRLRVPVSHTNYGTVGGVHLEVWFDCAEEVPTVVRDDRVRRAINELQAYAGRAGKVLQRLRPADQKFGLWDQGSRQVLPGVQMPIDLYAAHHWRNRGDEDAATLLLWARVARVHVGGYMRGALGDAPLDWTPEVLAEVLGTVGTFYTLMHNYELDAFRGRGPDQWCSIFEAAHPDKAAYDCEDSATDVLRILAGYAGLSDEVCGRHELLAALRRAVREQYHVLLCIGTIAAGFHAYCLAVDRRVLERMGGDVSGEQFSLAEALAALPGGKALPTVRFEGTASVAATTTPEANVADRTASMDWLGRYGNALSHHRHRDKAIRHLGQYRETCVAAAPTWSGRGLFAFEVARAHLEGVPTYVLTDLDRADRRLGDIYLRWVNSGRGLIDSDAADAARDLQRMLPPCSSLPAVPGESVEDTLMPATIGTAGLHCAVFYFRGDTWDRYAEQLVRETEAQHGIVSRFPLTRDGLEVVAVTLRSDRRAPLSVGRRALPDTGVGPGVSLERLEAKALEALPQEVELGLDLNDLVRFPHSTRLMMAATLDSGKGPPTHEHLDAIIHTYLPRLAHLSKCSEDAVRAALLELWHDARDAERDPISAYTPWASYALMDVQEPWRVRVFGEGEAEHTRDARGFLYATAFGQKLRHDAHSRFGLELHVPHSGFRSQEEDEMLAPYDDDFGTLGSGLETGQRVVLRRYAARRMGFRAFWVRGAVEAVPEDARDPIFMPMLDAFIADRLATDVGAYGKILMVLRQDSGVRGDLWLRQQLRAANRECGFRDDAARAFMSRYVETHLARYLEGPLRRHYDELIERLYTAGFWTVDFHPGALSFLTDESEERAGLEMEPLLAVRFESARAVWPLPNNDRIFLEAMKKAAQDALASYYASLRVEYGRPRQEGRVYVQV